MVWFASAKSSLLARARANDRAMTTSIIHAAATGAVLAVPVNGKFTGAVLQLGVAAPRIPVSRFTHGGLRPDCHEATNVRLRSMFPASVGLSRVSHGWYHRERTECLAHEVRVDTRPRETRLCAVISGNVFQSLFVGSDF